jgi:conjugal transfer pilus assembly protein TraU
MKSNLLARMAAILWLLMLSARATADMTCPNGMFNPVTDICWSCVMPVSIGSFPVGNIGGRSDIENPSSPVCACGFNVGLTIGFWEPALLTEVVRTPYCFPALGGLSLGAAIPAPRHGRSAAVATGDNQTSFYQAHYYIYPALFILGVLYGDPCLDSKPWDLGYITEVDPTWNDPALSSIFNAEAMLFANPISIAACAEDCLAATTNVGLPTLFWCAGCQGSIYTTDGWVPHHNGLVDSSLLLTQRLLFKLHKQGTAWRYNGSDALCGPVIDFMMDKRAYRSQMVAPIPASDCSALGASSISWRAGKEYPFAGEDAAYLLFRKRNCCETSAVPAPGP